VNNFISIPPLIGTPDDMDNSATPDQVRDGSSSGQSEPNAVDGNRFERWKSAASATAKLFLRGAKESTDVFPPLKSVVGGLCFILDNFEVWQLAVHATHSAYKNPSGQRQISKPLSCWHPGLMPFLPHSVNLFLRVMLMRKQGGGS